MRYSIIDRKVLKYLSEQYNIPQRRVFYLYEQAEDEVKSKYGVYNDYLKPLTIMVLRKWLEAESVSMITDKFLKKVLQGE